LHWLWLRLSDSVSATPGGRLPADVGSTVRVRTATCRLAWGAPRADRCGLCLSAIAYSPDSRLLAVGTEDGQVLFWDARHGVAETPALQVAPAGIAQISFSADGTMMVVSSEDGSTTLWDVRSRTQIGGSFPERPSIFTSPVFEPNGKLLIQYISDAAQWPTDVDSWERFACQVAGRDLTPAEWHAIVPARPYMHVCG